MRILDGHNDVLLRCLDADDPVGAIRAREGGHLDLERARTAGLAAGFFAAYVPSPEMPDPEVREDSYRFPFAPTPDLADAREDVYRMFELLHRAARELDGFRVVTSLGDLDACLDGDAVGAIPHVEGAEAIAPDLSNLDFLHAAGLRSLGVVWSRPNEFGKGVPFEYPGHPDTGPGLTDAGRRLVRACEDRGVLVDGAHMNAATLRETLDELDGPMAVTHTGAHAVCPHSRNLTDDLLRAVADAGGVVGVTFGAMSFANEPDPNASATIADVADHVEHIVETVGIEHVALGSDFDGAGLVADVADVTDVERLLDSLRGRGFSEDELETVAWRNWRRLLGEVWD